MVSPAKPVTGRPSHWKVTSCERSISSPCRCASRGSATGLLLASGQLSRPRHLQHLVTSGVALGLEPLAAAGGVEPPLALVAAGVGAEVEVVEQCPLVVGRRGAVGHLAAVRVLVDGARTAVGTGEY